MAAFMANIRANSRSTVVSSRIINAQPEEDNKGLKIVGPNGHAYAPTHWSFGQLAQLAEAPAGYLRSMPSPIAADCLNYGLQYKRAVEDVGVLLYRNGGDPVASAFTGPNYGRIWNGEVVEGLMQRFGDGVSGDWRVPGEFKQAVTITKENTTLYASDRDMFVFLADEKNRIEIPNRRDGQPGSFARGFYVWNSEVGSATLGLAAFLFDYVCCNRMIWGAEQFQEIRIRHTAGAPDRYLEEVAPVLTAYAQGSSAPVVKLIEDARAKRLDNVDAFLAGRFGKRMVESIKATHAQEEGRPIETLWDVSVAVTAAARAIPNQDRRVDLERQAGEVLALAA